MKWAPCLVLVCGCASVLGVDKTYVLRDAGAGDTAAFDAGVSEAAAPGQIRCGDGTSCPSSTEECCFGSDQSLACASTAPSDPCPDGTDIVCDDPSDCPGTRCCMSLQSDQSLLGTQCEATCQAGELPLCDPDGAPCAQGSCVSVPVKPAPPFTTPWFYGCQ